MKTKPIKIRGRHGGPRPNSGRRPSSREVDATKYYSPEVKAALKGTHGGPRPNSGRPLKLDKQDWAQVSCFLRRDTIEKLRASATPPGAPKLRERFGKYLQWHLDRYPPLSYELWQLELEYDAKEAARKAAIPSPRKSLSRADRAILKELRDALKAKNRSTPQLAK
jgi:hypothetical protein